MVITDWDVLRLVIIAHHLMCVTNAQVAVQSDAQWVIKVTTVIKVWLPELPDPILGARNIN